MRINTNNINNIEIDHTHLENVTSFIHVYLRCVNNQLEDTDDVKPRLAKAYTAFGMPRKVWKSEHITKTKLRVVNSNVKLYCFMGRKHGALQWPI